MVVMIDAHALGLKGQVIMKLYDRRFAAQLRHDNAVPPWTLDIEREYRKFVFDGGASELITKLHAMEDLPEEEGDSWSAAQNETYIYHLCRKYYDTESEAYRRVEDLQGKDVPRFIARVSFSEGPCSPTSSNHVSKWLDCPGILLELINGFPLWELEERAPKDAWQYICEDAIRIVNLIGDRDLRNEDIHLNNNIVRKDPITGKFKVFIIDFAMCVLRKPEDDKDDWWYMKATVDEEGRIGHGMERHLKRGFVYHRTPQVMKLARKYKSEYSVYELRIKQWEKEIRRTRVQDMEALNHDHDYAHGRDQEQGWGFKIKIFILTAILASGFVAKLWRSK